MGVVKLDFQVLRTNDPKVLLVADNSMWEHLAEKPSIIEIIVPGASTPIVHYFTKNSINGFNTVNLNLNCFLPCGCDSTDYYPLPDGIYTLTVKGSPDTFSVSKYHLKTDKMRLELAKLYYDMHLECENMDPSKKKNIDELNFLVEAAEANIRLSNLKEASELFSKAKTKLERYLKNV